MRSLNSHRQTKELNPFPYILANKLARVQISSPKTAVLSEGLKWVEKNLLEAQTEPLWSTTSIHLAFIFFSMLSPGSSLLCTVAALHASVQFSALNASLDTAIRLALIFKLPGEFSI